MELDYRIQTHARTHARTRIHHQRIVLRTVPRIADGTSNLWFTIEENGEVVFDIRHAMFKAKPAGIEAAI